MKNKILSIALLILLSTTFGCRLMMKQLQVDFFKGNAAQKAAQAVKSKVGFSFKVQEVEITENSFKMKIETPGNAQNIDEYTSLGYYVSEPKPVQLNGNTRTLDKLPFEEIDFTVVPQIIKNALEKTQIEGGAVTKITFMTYVGNKFGWDVQIQGTRESASARADMAGNIVSVNLSQTNRAANYKVLNEDELNKAADAIRAKFGENTRFEEITIRENSIGLKVINPENPQKVESYSFGIDGLKKSPMISLPASALNEAFDFNTINLMDALNLAPKAKARLDLPNGQISLITVERRRSFTKAEETAQIIWTISVNQGANSRIVSYDSKLNEISVRKN